MRIRAQLGRVGNLTIRAFSLRVRAIVGIASLWAALGGDAILHAQGETSGTIYCAGVCFPGGQEAEGVTLHDDSRADAPPRPFVTVRSADEARDAAMYFRPMSQPSRTLAALRKPVKFKYLDQPLESLMEEFQTQTGVPFFLDEAGLEESAITSDSEVTMYVDGMTAAAALAMTLSDLDLDYVANEEYVLITSRDRASETRETRTYAIVDHPLLRGEDSLKFARTLRKHVERATETGASSVAVDVLPGALVITADRRSHEAAERLMRQYAEVLAACDAVAGAERTPNPELSELAPVQP